MLIYCIIELFFEMIFFGVFFVCFVIDIVSYGDK